MTASCDAYARLRSSSLFSFQAMIIMACHDVASPLEVFDAVILEDTMSIFITSAFLKLIQGMSYMFVCMCLPLSRLHQMHEYVHKKY